jgi:hypothetical protein
MNLTVDFQNCGKGQPTRAGQYPRSGCLTFATIRSPAGRPSSHPIHSGRKTPGNKMDRAVREVQQTANPRVT